MMDETIGEILSRFLDGDLDSEEERELKAWLEAEPTLMAELDAMRRLRDSVAALAASDRVPPELDSLVDPLLRGRPEPMIMRPWARWLATAAAVILGATVIIEVNRRDSGPSIESMARLRKEGHPAESTERFALAPLPTSSLPSEQQPLGAVDRLLASPIPDVELDHPPPLEIRGPLEERDLPSSFDRASGNMRDEAGAKSSAVTAGKDVKKAEGLLPAAPGEKGDREHEPQSEEIASALESGRGTALRSWEEAPPPGRAQLFVFIDGRAAWREFMPASICKAGRYSVRIIVAGGAVREARPVGGAASASPSQRLCAAGLVLDLEIEEVADGEYPAEIVVEPRRTGE